jgi:pimeloyl-ACP methyl ester carboxylesterase
MGNPALSGPLLDFGDAFGSSRTMLNQLALPKDWNAPAFAADAAFRLFCSPSQSTHRPRDYRKLANQARFHLRHANSDRLDTPGGEIQTYIFEPHEALAGTILLIHGWAAEGAFLAAYAEPLRRRGFRVVAFDLPAHGQSEGRYTNLAACARAAHRVAMLSGPLKGIIGHSMGGLVSLWIAEGGPPLPSAIGVERIVLLGCPNRLIDLTREFGKGLNLCPIAQLGFERRVSRVGHRPVSGFSAVNLLKRIDSAVLAVHSEDDREVPLANARDIATARTHARLLVRQGLGHSGLLYDSSTIRSVIAFLRGD